MTNFTISTGRLFLFLCNEYSIDTLAWRSSVLHRRVLSDEMTQHALGLRDCAPGRNEWRGGKNGSQAYVDPGEEMPPIEVLYRATSREIVVSQPRFRNYAL